ncbi:MAG: rRNA maturation RNAse YbeY [bacterium]
MERKIILNTSNSKIKKLANKVYRFFATIFPEITKKLIIVDFVDELQIKKIKKNFWKIGKTTDTITLIFEDSVQIYLCLNIIKQNSIKLGNSFENEFCFVFLHSLLHSLGKNEEEVSQIQNYIFEKFLTCNF